MASKYQSGLTIPEQFPGVLRDFVREILRHQPANLYQFGAEYFQSLVEKARRKPIHEMNPEELEQFLYQIFMAADKDGNGTLDRQEFKELLHTAELGLSKRQVMLLYTEADCDDNGVVDYQEFVKSAVTLIQTLAAQQQARDTMAAEEEIAEAAALDYVVHGMSSSEIEALVQAAWQEADVDGSGMLDRKEFKRFLKSLSLGLTRKEINYILADVDVNQDGLVSFQEFLPLMHRVLVELVKQQFMTLRQSGSELEDFVRQRFEAAEPSGVAKPAVARNVLRDLDVGLSKFQLFSILSEVPMKEGRVHVGDFAPVAARMIYDMVGPEATQMSSEVRQAALAAVGDEELFVSGMSMTTLEDKLLEVFRAFDTDGSGFIEYSEFCDLIASGLNGSGIEFSPSQMGMLMAAADEDEDGRISYLEILKVFLALLEVQDRERRVGEYQPGL